MWMGFSSRVFGSGSLMCCWRMIEVDEGYYYYYYFEISFVDFIFNLMNKYMLCG